MKDFLIISIICDIFIKKFGGKMPRLARNKSRSGIYHIMLRGINKQEIFHDDEDKVRFLETLNRYKKITKIEVYAWCLMHNHLHLLLKEGDEELAITMKRVGVSFSWYYNKKYRWTGHLFQDRYRSENVESDEYLMTVLRYIHQNPVKAGIVQKPLIWKWSSCSGYYGIENYPTELLDCSVILGLFSADRIDSIKKFKEFNELINEDLCMDDNTVVRLTDDEAKSEILKQIGNINIIEIKNLPKIQRDEIVMKAKDIEGLSQRQLSRILGISQTLISKT
jgi:Transposase and inactivated derivatives